MRLRKPAILIFKVFVMSKKKKQLKFRLPTIVFQNPQLSWD